MKLVCLVSIFLFLLFKSGDGRWDLREVVICSVYCLVYSVEFLQKTVTFSFQYSLISLDASLGVIQRLDFIDGRFC